MRAHSSAARRRASRRARRASRPCASRWSSRLLIVSPTSRRNWRGRAVLRRRDVGRHRLELRRAVERPVAERGVDGEDLPVGDVAHRPGLGHLVALDGERRRRCRRPRPGGRTRGTGRWPRSSPDRTSPRAPRWPRRAPRRRTGSRRRCRCPGVTGSFQRNRLWVGSRPRKVRVSIGARIVRAPTGLAATGD